MAAILSRGRWVKPGFQLPSPMNGWEKYALDTDVRIHWGTIAQIGNWARQTAIYPHCKYWKCSPIVRMQITDSCLIVLLSNGANKRVSGWILLVEEKDILIDKGACKRRNDQWRYLSRSEELVLVLDRQSSKEYRTDGVAQHYGSDALSLNRESKQLYF